MFQSFITSLDKNQYINKPKKQKCSASADKQSRLRQMIRDIIASMINIKEICAQAALNIGLSTSILDFEKLLKFVNSQVNPSTLTFTYMQLKTLQKQSNKLKNAIHTPKDQPKQYVRSSNRQGTLNPVHDDSSKKQLNEHQRMAKAFQQELAFRMRVRQLNSRQKIQKKQQLLKKRVQKAKSMNKRAFRIYKHHKQQQSKAYDFFKIQLSPSKPNKNKNQIAQPTSKPQQKDHTITFHQQSYDIQQKPTCKLLNISIMRDSFTAPQFKSKTAGTKLRSELIGSDSLMVNPNKQRFIQNKRRQMEVRSNKIQLEKQKEEQALYKLIKKQERLNQIQQANMQQSSKIVKKHQKAREEALTSSNIQQIQLKLDSVIKEKCEEKVFKKEMHLQQQVNRIRSQLKIKQQRRQRHRIKKQRQHQQKMQQNQEYLKNYNTRFKKLKQNDFRHQMAIKQRHQQSQQKQFFNKIISNLAKYTDKQLIKSIQKLKNTNHSQSLFNLNPN